ncbi:MAG: hypothetical protein ABIX01_02715 [Chitinophagaceae bacterium]
MKIKTESAALRFIRSLAMGVVLSMLFFYSIHVFGNWTVEKYFPGPETTATVLLHNKCAIIGSTHTLRPNTVISGLDDGINSTKLRGSFINFSDGHVPGMTGLGVLLGSFIFFIRNIKKRRTNNAALDYMATN